MKQIRKLLALVLACLTLVLALPSVALAANRGKPAGYVSQVKSVFTMPKLFYVLAYKGNEVNPGNAQGGVLLETASSDAVFAGFRNWVGVTVGTARTAGRYTDTLTFRFALV